MKTARANVDHALSQRCGIDASWSWRFRIQKALILASSSSPREALELLGGDLPSSLATTDIGVRKNLVEGMAYRVAQMYDKAEEKLNSAEDLATRFQPAMLCEVLNYRGALEFKEKKYNQATTAYQRALDSSRQFGRHDQEANALVGLALVATGIEHFDEAIDRNQDALRLSGSLDLQGLVSTAMGNLGWSYFELGDFERALDFYRQGAQVSANSGLSGYSAYWFSGVANSYLALHEYPSAEELALTTLKRARELKDSETVTECLNTLTEVMLRTDRLVEAEQYNQDALQTKDKTGTLDTLLFAGQIATARKRFIDAENIFRHVLAEPSLGSAVKWEAEAGLARLWDEQGRFLDSERQYLKAIRTIEQARRSVTHDELRLSFLSSGMRVYGEYLDFLVRQGRPDDALRQAEISRARTLAEGLTITSGTAHYSPRGGPPQQTARKLHASLLFYWIGESNSYLWVITPAKTAFFKLPKASEIDPLVKSYRKSVMAMRDASDAGSAEGKKLYAMLVEPGRKLIPMGSQVIVLPSESLYGLNFETLIVPDPQPHFWIEDVTLTTANSLTLLGSSAIRVPSKEKSLLLVGNTEQPNPDFPALAQAAEEMKKIEGYFPDQKRKVLEGKQATATAYLKSSPEKYSYLHFVTHGTASLSRPLESAVILSPEGDSYKLYARDIVQHRLNANLVTISACNGAGTRAYSGEGLVGLSWAFLRAGAHNVIGALWEVSDASTPQLMDAFYRELLQGKDPATALRDAKLGLLHSADPDSVFKNPFYWAPFQLYAGS